MLFEQGSINKDKMTTNTTQIWQEELANLITDPVELINVLELDTALIPAAKLASQQFPLKVTQSYLRNMQKRDPNDPLLRQVLPLGLELQVTPGYQHDALAESKANPVPGLLHKYPGRILLTLTGACAVNCRFCFRRHFPYHENNPGRAGWTKIYDYLRADPLISEVILSGGDPLTMNDLMLQQFTAGLLEIPSVKRIRFHTRIPVVLPTRITPTLLEWINNFPLDMVMVIHANHPNELSQDVKEGLLKLHEAGVTLLNQSVLLRGVNDHADTLVALSEMLFAAKVLPYYLHALDKVTGAAHFDMPRAEAVKLHQTMNVNLPGYLVPRLVYEEPGTLSKQPYL